MKPITYSVGHPFPGPVPQSEGCVLELAPAGALICLIQMPGLSSSECQSFKKSFSKYGYLESSTFPPVAFWIWKFPAPLNAMDVNFNAALVDQNTIDNYLALENGQVKNLIIFYLLDGNMLAGIKAVGLDPVAVKLFHGTIRKQLKMVYNLIEYDKVLKTLYTYSTDELYQMSMKFSK